MRAAQASSAGRQSTYPAENGLHVSHLLTINCTLSVNSAAASSPYSKYSNFMIVFKIFLVTCPLTILPAVMTASLHFKLKSRGSNSSNKPKGDVASAAGPVEASHPSIPNASNKQHALSSRGLGSRFILMRCAPSTASCTNTTSADGPRVLIMTLRGAINVNVSAMAWGPCGKYRLPSSPSKSMLKPAVTDRLSRMVFPGSRFTLIPSIELRCRVGCLLRATESPSSKTRSTVIPGSNLGHSNSSPRSFTRPVTWHRTTTFFRAAVLAGCVTLPSSLPHSVSM
ncbi:unknown [Singapore grouper iridovirus]|uniref:Uncharacterized protein n=1 Tax=Singapore grouper iridovirus TaxID=262968 RepID=Q5YFF9_9VIRU|nr:hypothetical protein ORF106R [Singapore grouper iridovirus]AAS18121.1 unknown [Singapore grouper iridovirus]WAU86815.1 hypothetical protein ORF106R [Singapore grouper iridovirus]